MKHWPLLLVLTLGMSMFVAGCGGDGDDSSDMTDLTDDDPLPVDAVPGDVVEVTCPTPADAEVTTNVAGDAYVPVTTTIAVGEIVHFEIGGSHNALGDGWTVGFGGDECLQFNAVGSFGFECGPHGFTGTIEVE